jgi:hypothetical protein
MRLGINPTINAKNNNTVNIVFDRGLLYAKYAKTKTIELICMDEAMKINNKKGNSCFF